MQKNGPKCNSDGRNGTGLSNKGNYGRLTKTKSNHTQKSKKVVPKAKHHTIAKRNNYSIQERVAAVKANNNKKKTTTAAANKKKAAAIHQPSGNRSSANKSGKWNVSGGDRTNGVIKRVGRRNVNLRSTKNNNHCKVRDRRKPNKYQMRLGSTYNNSFNSSHNNQSNLNDPHLKLSDVPWCDAELQDRFRDNHGVKIDSSETIVLPPSPSFTRTTSKTSMITGIASYSSTSSKGLPQLPSETILQAIDDELYSFSMYVRLTHTERAARMNFLDHVAEQATFALLDFPSSHTSFRYNKKNVNHNIGKVGGGGEREGHSTAEKGRVRVVPFGSFATQEVCCFASDVDMCLWGVVECEPTLFIGDDDEEEEDVDSDVDDSRYRNDGSVHGGDDGIRSLSTSGISFPSAGGDGCPLMTESSLLRTMDAIQSASAKGLLGDAPSVDAASSADTSGEISGNKRRQHHQQQPSKSDTINREVDECLFFIDRVGEAAESAGSQSIDTIHQRTSEDGATTMIKAISATNGDLADKNCRLELGKHENMPEVVIDSNSSPSPSLEGFHFDADEQGVKELGGNMGHVEVVDLTSLDASSLPDDEKVHTSRFRDQRAHCKRIKNNCDGVDVKESNVEVPSNSGKSIKDSVTAINDGNSSDDDTSEVVLVKSVNEYNEDDDDSDSADKMSSYYHRQDPSGVQRTGIDSQASPIVLLDDDSSSSSADCDDEYSSSDSDYAPFDSSENEVIELSLTSDNGRNGKMLSGMGGGQHAKKPIMGPTGKARTQVVSALVSLTRQLRKSNFTHTIECRTKARVPIINCSTRTGFEGDIAIGGHNGVDTSMYAMSQVKRFRSFAPVVLLLKIILAQQGLDKPFTGGLGSYRLYVLAALAIERHLANGGNDRPSEVLISLLFRYGCIGTPHENQSTTTTDLERLREKKVLVSCDGGSCDLELVFRISDCVDMFRECHARLFARILMVNDAGNNIETNEKLSFLSSVIDCFRLREARETSDRRSKMCDANNIGITPVARNDPGKVNGCRRIGKVFSKSDGPENWLKRGPRGNIVPKKRPDLEAKNSSRGVEVLQRAIKNRKNNKKQKRDAALRDFASRQLQHG